MPELHFISKPAVNYFTVHVIPVWNRLSNEAVEFGSSLSHFVATICLHSIKNVFFACPQCRKNV